MEYFLFFNIFFKKQNSVYYPEVIYVKIETSPTKALDSWPTWKLSTCVNYANNEPCKSSTDTPGPMDHLEKQVIE